jgi:hypothetical protein
MAAPAQDVAATYKQWYGLAAGSDKEGVGGAEAVKFFARSGLDQPTMGQARARAMRSWPGGT